jgi:hypothetical protein
VQTPPDLQRTVAINKDLARLAPVVEAFRELSQLQEARAVNFELGPP